jgi:rhodanese-related sulfurtransferase
LRITPPVGGQRDARMEVRMSTVRSVPEVQASEVPDGGWLLDVREPYEWAAGHVPTATHIPMSQLNHRAGEIPRDGTVYVICRSGNRSAAVVQALAQAGWQAVNVGDGMQGWAAAGRPMISDTGSAPAVA